MIAREALYEVLKVIHDPRHRPTDEEIDPLANPDGALLQTVQLAVAALIADSRALMRKVELLEHQNKALESDLRQAREELR